MQQVNDCRHSWATTQLSLTQGQINDLERDWLTMQLSQQFQYSDAWFVYLGGKGFSGSYNDRWFSYLGSLGATGNLSDRLTKAFCDDLITPVGGDWILATGFWDDNGIWIDTETWRDS